MPTEVRRRPLPASGPRRAAAVRDRVTGREWRDARGWLLVVAAGATTTWVAVRLHARLGTHAPPFTGAYALRADAASALAPVVAAGVLLACRRRLPDRLAWRPLLWAAWGAAAAWALSLALVDGRSGVAGPVSGPGGYLSDVPQVAGDPLGYVHDFVATVGHHAPAARRHPPAPVLLLWALGRAGLHDPLLLGLLVVVVGTLSVPLVAVCVRSLCGEPAARALLPLLVLAPWTLWLAVSMDAVTLTVAAAAVACGVRASDRSCQGWASRGWGTLAGLLVGVTALFSYSAPWLGICVVLVYFVRRRALLNIATGLGALVPLWLASLAGFTWTRGLSAAQADFSLTVGPYRSWLVWGFLDVAVVAMAAGPAVVAAARKAHRTPGWPLVVGALVGVGFAVLSGLTRGEAERSLLPFLPWLLVPAAAPEPPASGRAAAPAPALLLAGLGAAGAIVLQAVLRSPW